MFITIVMVLMFKTFVFVIVTDVNISFIQEQYVLMEGETIPISVLISVGPGVNASGNISVDVFYDLDTPRPQCKQFCAIFVCMHLSV